MENNQNNNLQLQPIQLQEEQSQPIAMSNENPSVEAQEENKKRNENKKGRNNKRNFNKKQLNENATVKTAETMITKDDEIKPVIPEPRVNNELEEKVVTENTSAETV